ncbi:non-ribosomal peptide synthetase [Plantactinospora sp. DSM 117369]
MDSPALGRREADPPIGDPVAVVARIWAAVLDISPDQLHPSDNFFELGGHSLLAAKVQLRLRDELSVAVAVSDVLGAATLADLAERVRTAPPLPARPAAQQVEPVRPGPAAPLSAGQERLWFLNRLEPASAFYNVAVPLRLRGQLDVAALLDAVTALVDRHEILRTRFPARGGEPCQEVTSARLTVPVVDFAGLPAATAQRALDRLLPEVARQPFDLVAGPITRCVLFRRATADHVLMLAVHHIACDGSSLAIMLSELAELYRARRADVPADLPSAVLQYRDFARWQRAEMRDADFAGRLAEWRAVLAGAPGALALPPDHPRPAVQTFAGATFEFTLDAALGVELTEFARARRVTPFMVVLAVYARTLATYAEQSEVVIGVPTIGRGRSEFARTIGFFVNTLPLRVDLSGDPSLTDLLARVRDSCLDGYDRQDVPFEKVVEVLRLPRDVSRTPLVQVLASWQEEDALPAFDNLAAEILPVTTGTAKLDLSLFLAAGSAGVKGTVEYATDLFEADTVRCLVDSFRTLLGAALAAPAQPLSSLPLLSVREWGRVVGEWAGSRVWWGVGGCVHGLVVGRGGFGAGGVAVRGGGVELSFVGLLGRAWGLAGVLRGLGVGPEVRVGVMVGRSVGLVVGLLGVLCAGGAYVPLDPEYPVGRLELMVADAGVGVLVVGRDVVGRLAGFGGVVVVLEDVVGVVGEPFESGVGPENLAYVIYTSGSTGTPKGVAMPHRALVNLIRWQLDRSTLTDQPTMQFPPLSFDMSFLDIFYTLAAGRTLVFPPDDVRRDPSARVRFVAEERIGCFVLSPAALRQHAAATAAPDLDTVTEYISAGEQLTVNDDIARLFARPTDRVLVNQYGPTETHCVTAYELRAPSTTWPARVPIGRPIANCRVYVLDRHLKPVPVGVAGELCIGGEGLARGYLGQPALTAARFCPDPLAPEPGGRMYRTGDRARWRHDGELEFLNRLDDQVKIRGFRVEPAEVAATLARHPAVDHAVVAARGEADATRLVAYVRGTGTRASAGELRAFVARTLPDYMVPSAYVYLDEFPLTPSGKVDRLALPEPPAEASRATLARLEPPGTDLERRIAELWVRVLGPSTVGVRDNFFEVGGNSILLQRLHQLIESEFPGRLTLVQLLTNPTIATQAERLSTAAGPAPAPAVAHPVGGPAARVNPADPQVASPHRLRSRRAARGNGAPPGDAGAAPARQGAAEEH